MFLRRRKKTVAPVTEPKKEIVEVEQEKVWKRKENSLGFLGIGQLGMFAVQEFVRREGEIPPKIRAYGISELKRGSVSTKGWETIVFLGSDTVEGAGTDVQLGKKLVERSAEEIREMCENIKAEETAVLFLITGVTSISAPSIEIVRQSLNPQIAVVPVFYLPSSIERATKRALASESLYKLGVTEQRKETTFVLSADTLFKKWKDVSPTEIEKKVMLSFVEAMVSIINKSTRPSNDLEFYAGYEDLLKVIRTGGGYAAFVNVDDTGVVGQKASETQVLATVLQWFEKNGVFEADILNAQSAYVYVETYKTMQAEIEARKIPKQTMGQVHMKLVYSDKELQPLIVNGIFAGLQVKQFINKYLSRSAISTNRLLGIEKQVVDSSLTVPTLNVTDLTTSNPAPLGESKSADLSDNISE